MLLSRMAHAPFFLRVRARADRILPHTACMKHEAELMGLMSCGCICCLLEQIDCCLLVAATCMPHIVPLRAAASGDELRSSAMLL